MRGFLLSLMRLGRVGLAGFMVVLLEVEIGQDKVEVREEMILEVRGGVQVVQVLEGVLLMVEEDSNVGIGINVQVQKRVLEVVEEILGRDEIDINYSPRISFSIL